MSGIGGQGAKTSTSSRAAGSQFTDIPNEPPPPYSENDPATTPALPPRRPTILSSQGDFPSSSNAASAASSSSSSSQPQQQHPQRPPLVAQGSSAIARQFPPWFNIYSNDPFHRFCWLGQHQNQPLYAVSLNNPLTGNPDLVLHNGPDARNNPPLALADFPLWGLGTSINITLPPLDDGGGQQQSVEELTVAYEGFTRRFCFSIEVLSQPNPNQPSSSTGLVLRREAFEWRHSRGEVIQNLDGRLDGWKLVRLGDGSLKPAPPGWRFPSGVPATSDGREIVMAFTEARMSLSKSAKYTFLGSGASGELGERFAVMAVITGLAIWEREWKSKYGHGTRRY